VTDPAAPPFNRQRGGAWWSVREANFRAASRFFAEAAHSSGATGLRLVARLREAL
jgi:hypothetical protein